MHQMTAAALVLPAVMSAGCGQYVRDQGRAPAQPVIMSLQAASGAAPTQFGVPLLSDVVTNVTSPAPCTTTAPCPTYFNDLGQVTMSMILKDPGQLGVASAPTELNQITFTRYHVTYRRTDGRNAAGVDVPYAFDGATTFTVPTGQNVTFAFELVRHDAKLEAPLLALRTSPQVINAIADVTFYGRDQAGNDVTVTGSIQIDFGNFADPTS
jgi:hypothetical protein